VNVDPGDGLGRIFSFHEISVLGFDSSQALSHLLARQNSARKRNSISWDKSDAEYIWRAIGR